MKQDSNLQRSHLLVNVVLILAVGVFGVVAIDHYFIRRTDSGLRSTSTALKPGSKLELKGFEWPKNRQTLVFALSNHCTFCSQSANFYRELLQQLKGRSEISTLAIFSEPLSDAQRYFKEIDLSFDDVRQASLAGLGLKGTPTLLLINETGQIKEFWTGKLIPEEETEVIDRIRAELAEKKSPPSTLTPYDRIDAQEAKKIALSGQKITILDVRNRQQYAGSHDKQSKNIPIDELEVRAPNELSTDDLIVTTCRCADATLSILARDRLVKNGFKKVAVLAER